MFVFLFGHGLKKLFLGHLREIEVEHLTDRIWGTVTDTLLAMTIFRSEFNASFLFWFTVLLFFKIFHWLAQDRVDFVRLPIPCLVCLEIFNADSRISLSLLDATLSIRYNIHLFPFALHAVSSRSWCSSSLRMPAFCIMLYM